LNRRHVDGRLLPRRGSATDVDVNHRPSAIKVGRLAAPKPPTQGACTALPLKENDFNSEKISTII